MEEKPAVKEIVSRAFDLQGTSLRGFANILTESLPNIEITHATIINWKKGKTEPETDFLEAMLVAYDPTDWRFDFALACLAAKSPLVWGVDGVVWVLRARTEVAHIMQEVTGDLS